MLGDVHLIELIDKNSHISYADILIRSQAVISGCYPETFLTSRPGSSNKEMNILSDDSKPPPLHSVGSDSVSPASSMCCARAYSQTQSADDTSLISSGWYRCFGNIVGNLISKTSIDINANYITIIINL